MTVHVLDLLDFGVCTASCLFGAGKSCGCRCGDVFHGFLRGVLDNTDMWISPWITNYSLTDKGRIFYDPPPALTVVA